MKLFTDRPYISKKNSIRIFVLFILSCMLYIRHSDSIYFINTFSLFFLLLVYGLYKIISGQKFLKIYKNDLIILIAIILFSYLVLFDLLWTNAINYGIYKSFIFSIWIITGFAIGTDLNNETVKKFLLFNVYIGFIGIIYFSFKFGAAWTILNEMSMHYRLGSEENNPIILSRYLGFFIISCLFYFFLEKSKVKLFFLLIPVILYSLIFMIFSGSKGPLVALAGAAFYFTYLINFNIKKIIFSLAIITSLYLLIFNIELPFLNDSFMNFVDIRYIHSEGSVSTRNDQFFLALQHIDAWTFLFGAGTGDYGHLYYGADQSYYPHNIFIEVLYENGIIGLIILSITFVYLLVKSIGMNNILEKYLLISSFYFFINAQFTGDISANAQYFLFLIMFIFYKNVRGKYEYIHHP